MPVWNKLGDLRSLTVHMGKGRDVLSAYDTGTVIRAT